MKIGVLFLVAAFVVASASSLGGTPLAAAGSVDFSLSPSSTTLEAGQTVDVTIQFDASTDNVGAAQAYLDFDPSVLQVVDSSDTPPTSINQGAVFTNKSWDELQNSVDNSTGQINFAGGKNPSTGMDATSAGVEFATFTFEALAETSGTTVSFSGTAPRETKAVSGVTVVTGTFSGLDVAVQSSVDVTFSFSVQGGGTDVPSWSMDAFEVEFYEAGTTNLVHSDAPATAPSTGSGSTFQVTGVPPNTEPGYDIWVKGANTLAQLHSGVAISDSSNTVDLGVQNGGDATGTEVEGLVDGADYSALVDSAVFGKLTTDLSDPDHLNDHNWDGVVDTQDHGIIVTNFSDTGDPKPGS